MKIGWFPVVTDSIERQRVKERKSQRDKESKSQRDKESKRQRVKETKSQRVKETKRQRDRGRKTKGPPFETLMFMNYSRIDHELIF